MIPKDAVTCDICEALFLNHNSLRAHKGKKAHKLKEKQTKAAERTLANLTRHIVEVHRQDAATVDEHCPFCNTRFDEPLKRILHVLRKHPTLMTRTGMPPGSFFCRLCQTILTSGKRVRECCRSDSACVRGGMCERRKGMW